MWNWIHTLFILCVVLTGIDAGNTKAQENPTVPLVFHCAYHSSCPEIQIDGDPTATLNGIPSPFRGIGDPSLEYDAATGILWLSYSWLNTFVTPTDNGPAVNFGVQTHLARSMDNGLTFQYVSAINEAEQVTHPAMAQTAWTVNEVSTLLHQPDGNWQVMWLSYFNPLGQAGTKAGIDFHMVRSLAASPDMLGREPETWASGWAINPSIDMRYNLSSIEGLENCAAFTEPGLFSYEDKIFLAANCIVIDLAGPSQQFEQSRMILLRQTDNGYALVGTLLDYEDAQHFGADEFTQADISIGRDGSILLTTTPLIDRDDTRHQGCMVFEVSDIGTATVRRDSNNIPFPRAIISADGNGLGPGLCTYDAHSETGVMLVITQLDLESNPPIILFSLRATGIHP